MGAQENFVKKVAGRISPVERYAGQITDLEAKIADRLPDILDTMFTLAMGEATEEVLDIKTGEMKVRRLAPDRQALEYLVNRIAGKPQERRHLEVEASGNGTFAIYVGPAAVERRTQRQLEATTEGEFTELPSPAPLFALPAPPLAEDAPLATIVKNPNKRKYYRKQKQEAV